MGKKICILVLVMALLFSSVAGALSIITGLPEASYVEGLQRVESFVEVEIESVTPFAYPKLKEGESIAEEYLPPFTVVIEIKSNIRGKSLAEGETALNMRMGFGYEVKPGERYILGLNENDPAERKRLAESESYFDYDPGKYSVGALLRIGEEGDLTGLTLGDRYYFPTYDYLFNQLEGRVPSRQDEGKSTVMYYNGQVIQRAYVIKEGAVYKKRDINSKKLMTLEPYDFVLQVGESDSMDGESWDKILLADGRLGFLEEGALEKLSYSVDKDINTLVKVPKNLRLRDAAGKTLPVGRLVVGTAAALVDDQPWDEKMAKKYLTASTGMQTKCLVEKWDWERMDRPEGLKMTAGVHDFGVEDEAIEEFTTQSLVNGAYRTQIATEKIYIYDEADEKAKVAGSIPKNGLFLQMEAFEPIYENKIAWMAVFFRGKTFFVQKNSAKPMGEIIIGGDPIYADRNTYAYKYDGYDFYMTKEAASYKHLTILTKEWATVNGRTYAKVLGVEGDDLWIRER